KIHKFAIFSEKNLKLTVLCNNFSFFMTVLISFLIENEEFSVKKSFLRTSLGDIKASHAGRGGTRSVTERVQITALPLTR
ncbi:MAG: hypothetical protein IJW03_05185, partial [Clostridia bacterium]|nr:hypothetical protein [Clostridia bacterium]